MPSNFPTATTEASGQAHTPGPWTIIPARPYDGDEPDLDGSFESFASIEGSDGSPVCMFGDAAGSATMFENEADYRLIAAAPELFESLKNLVGLAEMTGPNLHRYRAAIDDARAALAKARPATCKTCGSQYPHLHPAVQFEGEVEICTDDFHLRPTPQNNPTHIAAVHAKRASKAEGAA